MINYEVDYKDINFNNNSKYKLGLMGCQIELILKSLQFYLYTYKFIYPRKQALSDEEELRISLVRDTYLSILSQFHEEPISNTKENYKKKIA